MFQEAFTFKLLKNEIEDGKLNQIASNSYYKRVIVKPWSYVGLVKYIPFSEGNQRFDDYKIRAHIQ
jgi:hypothetical protein